VEYENPGGGHLFPPRPHEEAEKEEEEKEEEEKEEEKEERDLGKV
jgi:ribosomal protein L12E/L44/L45/RPP1/RPP2